MNAKIGTLSLISIVIGSQIGSGALSSPAIFAHFGLKSIYSWLIAGFGALCLSYVFAQLCFLLPYTGGPHVYIKHAFGHTFAFYIGWLYWMVSWISTVVVLIAGIGYLSEGLHLTNSLIITLLGLVIWIFMNYLNLKGTECSSKVELLLTGLKIIFFCVFIAIPFIYFDLNNIKYYEYSYDFPQSICAALWGFIGIEVATTPAEDVHNPRQTIPKAVMIGTCCVALIYLLGNIAALGCVHHTQLSASIAPYSLISNHIFSSNFITNIMAFILCLGSINAWILASGQIALGLSKDGYLPPIFKQTTNQAPYFSIIITAIGVSFIWIVGMMCNLLSQIAFIIDTLTPGFIITYLFCCCALIKLSNVKIHRIVAVISIIFCLGLLSIISTTSLIVTSIIIILGIPLRLYLNSHSPSYQ